jgi:hypothetical protein
MAGTRQLLFVLVPALVATGVVAVRAVNETQGRVANDVVDTFAARDSQIIELPRAGAYRAFGIGAREAIQGAAQWQVSLREVGTSREGNIRRASAQRAEGRENRPGLDMLFAFDVPAGGRWVLRLVPAGKSPGAVTLRVTYFNALTAGAAMKSFGYAALFSLLLLACAVAWFRGR